MCRFNCNQVDIQTDEYSRDESKSHYEQFYSESDFKRHNRSDHALIKSLQEHYAIPDGASVLDVPCGTGKFSKYWKYQGYNTVGIDISETGIQAARENCPDCEFLVGDALNLPIGDEMFDVVFCHGFSLFNTMEFNQTRAFVNHAIEKLCQGGLFIWGKTSAMQNGQNRRKSRIDFTHDRVESFFKSIDSATYIETKSTIPHILPILGDTAFSQPISRSLQVVSRLTKLPVRTYVVLEK